MRVLLRSFDRVSCRRWSIPSLNDLRFRRWSCLLSTFPFSVLCFQPRRRITFFLCRFNVALSRRRLSFYSFQRRSFSLISQTRTLRRHRIRRFPELHANIVNLRAQEMFPTHILESRQLPHTLKHHTSLRIRSHQPHFVVSNRPQPITPMRFIHQVQRMRMIGTTVISACAIDGVADYGGAIGCVICYYAHGEGTGV
jgi:hypothetical protein